MLLECGKKQEVKQRLGKQQNRNQTKLVEMLYAASATVKGRLSGDLSRVSQELNRVAGELSRMAAEFKTFGAALSAFETSLVSNIEDMLKTFLANLVKNLTNPVILSPGPIMQHVPPAVPVNSGISATYEH